MTQSDCLASPHHFTHLGVCYVGTDASVTMYATGTVQDPHFTVTTPHAVPEPGTAGLFAIAIVLGALYKRPRCHFRSQ